MTSIDGLKGQKLNFFLENLKDQTFIQDFHIDFYEVATENINIFNFTLCLF